MSTAVETAIVEKNVSEGLPWMMWIRQTVAIFRLEVKKNFFGKRAILIYLLALMPVPLLATMAAYPVTARELRNPASGGVIFAGIFEGLILRTVIFYGCAWIAMNLFRGEIVDRSLHSYFLCPVRREVLVIGK